MKRKVKEMVAKPENDEKFSLLAGEHKFTLTLIASHGTFYAVHVTI